MHTHIEIKNNKKISIRAVGTNNIYLNLNLNYFIWKIFYIAIQAYVIDVYWINIFHFPDILFSVFPQNYIAETFIVISLF